MTTENKMSLHFQKDIDNGIESKINWNYDLMNKIETSVDALDKDKKPWSDLDWIMMQNIEFLKFITKKFKLNFKELYIEYNANKGYHLVDNEDDE
tara:strand:+ start:703 stop:987 length:285 start_codon:yes stop_codon:yes gene_type:complete